ncbi:hypothetical protein D3C71_1453180 [compost metagenome]
MPAAEQLHPVRAIQAADQRPAVLHRGVDVQQRRYQRAAQRRGQPGGIPDKGLEHPVVAARVQGDAQRQVLVEQQLLRRNAARQARGVQGPHAGAERACAAAGRGVPAALGLRRRLSPACDQRIELGKQLLQLVLDVRGRQLRGPQRKVAVHQFDFPVDAHPRLLARPAARVADAQQRFLQAGAATGFQQRGGTAHTQPPALRPGLEVPGDPAPVVQRAALRASRRRAVLALQQRAQLPREFAEIIHNYPECSRATATGASRAPRLLKPGGMPSPPWARR